MMFGQENLVRVAIWCIGEYADLLVNNNGMLELDEQITVSSIFRRVFSCLIQESTVMRSSHPRRC